MSRQWIRAFQLKLKSGGQTRDLSDLRVRFSIKNWTIQTPTTCEITITNLSDNTADAILKGKEGQEVELAAGYQDNCAILFKGQVKQVFKGRESPTDTFLFLNCAGEYGYNFARVNKTLKKGSTPKDMLDVAMKAFGEFDAQLGTVTPDLSKPQYPRSITLYGMARDVIREIALATDSTWHIHNGEIHIIEKNKSLKGGAIVLNSMTGLIGMPTQTFDGIQVRCLINPEIKPKCIVQIDEKSIQGQKLDIGTGGAIDPNSAKLPSKATDGRYKVMKLDITGDSRGTEWYMDMTCLSAKEGSTYVPESLLPYIGPQ